MSMTIQEIKEEANRLRKKADDIEWAASTLIYKHQKSAKAIMETKAKELRYLQKEYEHMCNNIPFTDI